MGQDAKIEFVFLGGGAEPTAGRAGAAPRDDRRKPLKNNPRAAAQEEARIMGGKPAGGSGEKGDQERVDKTRSKLLANPVSALRGARSALLASAPVVAAFAADRILQNAISSIETFSPDVAVAKAGGEVADIQRRLRLAQDIGPQLGEVQRLRQAVFGGIAETRDELLVAALGGQGEIAEGAALRAGRAADVLEDLPGVLRAPLFLIERGLRNIEGRLDAALPPNALLPLPEPLLPNDGPFAEGGGQRGTLELSPGLQLQ